MTGEKRRSFTVTARGGVLRVLTTTCGICPAYDPHAPPTPTPAFQQFGAIWDTGATTSAITQQVIDACGLKPIGMTRVHGFGGITDTELYLVNVALPNRVAIANVQVTRGILGAGPQVLIGMDLITRGDFSVTNKDGNTIFSFGIPSIRATDFVQEDNKHNIVRTPSHGGFSGGHVKGRRHK